MKIASAAYPGSPNGGCQMRKNPVLYSQSFLCGSLSLCQLHSVQCIYFF